MGLFHWSNWMAGSVRHEYLYWPQVHCLYHDEFLNYTDHVAAGILVSFKLPSEAFKEAKFYRIIKNEDWTA